MVLTCETKGLRWGLRQSTKLVQVETPPQPKDGAKGADARRAAAALFALVPMVAKEIHRHNHPGCTDLPPTLRRLSPFRPTTIEKDHVGAVVGELFRAPDTPFARETREVWLKNHPELAEVWRDPTRDDFAPFSSLDGAGARQWMGNVAATLWALGWDDSPSRRAAFAIIAAALAALDAAPRREVGSKADRHRDDKRAARQLKRTLRHQDAQVGQLRERERELTLLLNDREGALRGEVRSREKAVKGADDARARAEAAEKKRDALQKAVLLRNTQLETAKGEAERQRQRAEALERTVGELGEKVDALQEAQERLVAHLAQERKARADLDARIEHPEALIGSFISNRLARIDEELEVAQGGRVDELGAERKDMKTLRTAFFDAFPEFRLRPPTPILRRPPIRYWGLGGADEVGGSAYLIEIAGKRLLVDCGIRVGVKQLDELGPDLAGLTKLDAVIATHAHVDHVGWLPALRRQLDVDLPPIYLTRETSELLPVMLADSLDQLRRLIALRQLIALHSGTETEVEEPYDSRDKDTVLRQYLSSSEFGETNALRGDVRFRLFRAGHILGAASVLIESPDAKVFVTGDFSDFPQRTVESLGWPDDVANADLMILEATYGKTIHESRDGVINKFIGDVRRVVTSGGVALVACFALGRAQEILSILNDAFATGELKDIPVYIDGMIEQINPVYERYGRMRLSPRLFNGVRGNLWEREELIARLKTTAGIVVTTSGMMQGGPVVSYAQALLGSRKNQLFLTGYQEEASLGRRVMNEATKPGATVKTWDEDGKEIRIRLASPASVVSLSAHADRRGLLSAVERVRPKQVVLVHGEEEARAHLANELRQRRVPVAENARRAEA